MLQKTYSIYSDDLVDQQLFIESGKNHLACWCKTAGDKKLNGFEFFQFDDYTAFENTIHDARSHSRLLSMPVAETKFILNTDEVICIPLNSNSRDNDFIRQNFELLFGTASDAEIFSEEYADYLIATRIERKSLAAAQASFHGMEVHSQYGCLLPGLNNNENAAVLYLFFYPHYFSLIASTEGKLKLAQTRSYSTAEDVLYFILNALQQYSIEKNAEILTGGFIDEKSKLYEILYQYLEGLKLAHVDETLFASDAFKDYSPHYFLPYTNYVL